MWTYNFKKLINKFPKLKQRIYYFNEFKIDDSNNYTEYYFNIKNPEIIKLLNYDKSNYFLFDKNEGIEEYFYIYINNKKINIYIEYNFKKMVNIKIKIYKKNNYIVY